MTGRVFVDTNILIYAYDLQSVAKRPFASEIINGLWQSGKGAISTQVLQEFYVTATKKVIPPLSPSLARKVLRDYVPWVREPSTPATVIRASEIAESYQLSFWDGLIVASAEQQAASVILSEDLNHGQSIVGIQIVNPFAPTPPKPHTHGKKIR